MFKLRYGYLLTGIITGCILLVSFVTSLPDGKLHIFFCNVGQGDAAYVRLPDGRDMLIDGGPDDTVLTCLGRHMPFWDREINIVVNTHPQSDHLKGLISVLNRFKVDYVVRSDVAASSDVYAQFIDTIRLHHIRVKLVTRGEHITIGTTSFSVLWPSDEQLARGKTKTQTTLDSELNDYCVVLLLRYGAFSALLPGDADAHVEPVYQLGLTISPVSVLKVPHHGSKTGMTSAFVDWVRPQISVISVGKNSYGHPSAEAIDMLQSVGSTIHRTDQEGDIEVVSDGKNWSIGSKIQ